MVSLPPETVLSTAEFLVVDVETNGLGGERCELTEVGAVLVGGGELHDRWESLVGVRAPLSRGIQRLTGISQAMVDEAPAAPLVLPDVAELLRRPRARRPQRVVRPWRAAPGVRPRGDRLARSAGAVHGRDGASPAPAGASAQAAGAGRDALGIDVEVVHRALADAETCARVFCALFGKLCANAATVGEAVELLRARSRPPARSRAGATDGRRSLLGVRKRVPGLDALPDAPGVYVIRDAVGAPLYVGKSVSLRSRVRAHFAPSSPDSDWVMQAESVDHEETRSELGALVLEHRLIGRLRPPGNVRRQASRPLRLPALPAGHRVPDPRGRARPGGGARGQRRATARPPRRRSSCASSSTRCSACATAAARCRAASIRRPTGRWGAALSPCLGRPRSQRLPPAARRGAGAVHRLARRRRGAAGARRRADARGGRRAALRARRVAAPAPRPPRGAARAASATRSPRRTRDRGWCSPPTRARDRRRRVLDRRRADRRLGAGRLARRARRAAPRRRSRGRGDGRTPLADARRDRRDADRDHVRSRRTRTTRRARARARRPSRGRAAGPSSVVLSA